MRFGIYVSQKSTRFRKAVIERILTKENTAFAVTDYYDTQELDLICKDYEIPLYRSLWREKGLTGKERNEFISDSFLSLLNKYNCDYAFLLGCELLLQGKILSEYHNKIINFHCSLLPAYKAGYENSGFKVIDKALEENAIFLGNTAHFINEKADEGTIIMQSIMPARKFAGHDSVLDMIVPMLKQIICWLEEERFVFAENQRFYIKDAKYELDSYVPNLER
ncbi:MAG: hypothetical protein FWG91_02510 [Lachnospiraceae bacterium]|nr:hypothetical protein [Lachnospiraceae bacterium]